MARSTANKAKASAKKAQRAAPRPKAQISARAKLISVNSATGKVKTGSYQTETVNAIRLTLDVNIGAPKKAPSWPEYKGRNGWERRGYIEEKLYKLQPKAPKPKKGETPAAAPLADSFDEAAERERLGAEFDAQLRAKYEKECAKANSANARLMQHAMAFAMFVALRGQDVQLTLSPVQQGFTELFAGNGATPLLGAAEEPEDDDRDDLDDEDLDGDD